VQFLNEAKQKAFEFANANSAALLTAGGVVGTVATAILAGRAGFKAQEILLMKESEKMIKSMPEAESIDEPIGLTKLEKLVIVGPYFIPPVITGGATIAAIIMSNRISAQKAAALAAAYGLAERNLSEYKEKVAEKLTGPKQKAIDDELAQEAVSRTDGYGQIVVIEGTQLCFDKPTGRYFPSSMENLRSAVNTINAEILKADYVRASVFYEEIGLPATTWSDDVGWNTDHLLDLKYTTVLSPDNRPCIAIDFVTLPVVDYIPNHY
jgi:Family of unknown function (DUF6353)